MPAPTRTESLLLHHSQHPPYHHRPLAHVLDPFFSPLQSSTLSCECPGDSLAIGLGLGLDGLLACLLAELLAKLVRLRANTASQRKWELASFPQSPLGPPRSSSLLPSFSTLLPARRPTRVGQTTHPPHTLTLSALTHSTAHTAIPTTIPTHPFCLLLHPPSTHPHQPHLQTSIRRFPTSTPTPHLLLVSTLFTFSLPTPHPLYLSHLSSLATTLLALAASHPSSRAHTNCIATEQRISRGHDICCSPLNSAALEALARLIHRLLSIHSPPAGLPCFRDFVTYLLV